MREVKGLSRFRLSHALETPVRAIVRSRNPAILFAKRRAVSLLMRMNLVAEARLRGGGVIYVDLANAVGRSIWLRGDYSAEEAIVNLIASRLGSGDVFLDIGANVGFYSLMASGIVGNTGQVYAFEPLPRLANLLRRTVAANGVTNLVIVEAVVGSAVGTASIAAMADSAYSHVVDGANAIDDRHGHWTPVTVRAVTIDDYVRNVVRRLPRLIKMDIEGSEIEAVDGATAILSDPQGPDVICEVGAPHLARFNHTPAELFERFASHGYRPLHPRTLALMRLEDLSVSEYNVFFTKRAWDMPVADRSGRS